MKNKIIIFIVLALVIVGGVFLLSNSKPEVPATATDNTQTTTTDQTSTDTTTTAPKTPSYTLAQVALHKDAKSCWTAIRAGVYDLTNWINQHPGGAQAILSLCGTDGTAKFMAQHGGQAKPESELKTFYIGVYVK